jgi:hypothetical protein
MRTLTTIAATLGVMGAIAVGSAAPAAAWYGYHHRYYNYYGGGILEWVPTALDHPRRRL